MDRHMLIALSKDVHTLGGQLANPGEYENTLQEVVQLAVTYVSACEHVSVTMIRGLAARTLVSSGPTAAQADALQHLTKQGPSLRSVQDGVAHLIFDAATDPRWPSFTAALREQTAIRSVLTIPLVALPAATLNLFAETDGAFGDTDIEAAELVTQHVAGLIGLYWAQQQSFHLALALETNRDIGTAIGILMANRLLTKDSAFSLLKAASQDLHRKLHDIATEVLETGALPERQSRVTTLRQ